MDKELIQEVLTNVSRDCCQKTLIQVKPALKEYIQNDLKNDILKENLSGTTFIYRSSYEQWLATKMNETFQKCMQSKITTLVQEGIANEVEGIVRRLAEDNLKVRELLQKEEKTLSQKLNFNVWSTAGGESKLDGIVAGWMLLFGIMLFPATIALTPLVAGTGALVAGLGIISASIISFVGLLVSPFLHITIAFSGGIAIEHTVKASVKAKHYSGSVWWSSQPLIELAVDGVVNWADSNFEELYNEVESQLSMSLEESISNFPKNIDDSKLIDTISKTFDIDEQTESFILLKSQYSSR